MRYIVVDLWLIKSEDDDEDSDSDEDVDDYAEKRCDNKFQVADCWRW